jgi:serine/threonine-protein kinase
MSADEPVVVIEAIPVAGEQGVSSEEIQREGIPTPAGLRIFPELGRGVAGRIHPALDRNLLRQVALKRLSKDLARQQFYRDGFIAEAQITGQLEHPNVVPVHELVVPPDGVPYFTMKLVQGVSFDRWLKERPLGSSDRLEEGLEIFLKVCDAIAYAHHRGVIHRDIKPENVMVGAFGQTYVMDWGLARLLHTRPASGARAQMEAKGPVGSLYYMSPEQANGNPQEMDERSDVFGLGALLYQIVCGRSPYGTSRDAQALLARARAGQTVPIDEAVGQLPVAKRIRAIITRALAPKPADRYQSVVALADDVRRFLRGGLHLAEKSFAPGEVIIREGDAGDTAYMITRGTCRAFHTVDGHDEPLGTMGVGDVFGEMALLLYEPRAATVEAVDEVTTLLFDKQTLAEGLGVDGWTGALVRALAQRFFDLEQQVRSSGMRRGPA